jgi:secreted trypsin-like serine protease
MRSTRKARAALGASLAVALTGCIDSADTVATATDEEAVVGGAEALPGEYPWQAQLGVPGYDHYCGGSIIDREWILTAAHCVEGLTAADLTVKLGLHRRSAPDGNLQTRRVRRIVQHPDYSPSTLQNDVALLELTAPVTYQPRVQPIAIRATNAPVGTPAVVSGWGWTMAWGSASDALQEGVMPLESSATCNAGGTLGLTVDDATMVCAGTIGGSTGGCHGDSGGPLVVPRGFSGGYEQVGVVSWGVGGTCSSYTVFARLSAFAAWIASYTGPVVVYGDADGSGCVDTADLAAIMGAFGTTVPPGDPRDLNYDGLINVHDRLIVLQNFGEGCS